MPWPTVYVGRGKVPSVSESSCAGRGRRRRGSPVGLPRRRPALRLFGWAHGPGLVVGLPGDGVADDGADALEGGIADRVDRLEPRAPAPDEPSGVQDGQVLADVGLGAAGRLEDLADGGGRVARRTQGKMFGPTSPILSH